MKKGIIFIILIVFNFFGVNVEEVSTKETYQMIPDEAIRLRILANSDSDEDQSIKRFVRDEVNTYINELVKDIDNIEEARTTIDNEIPVIEDIVANSLKKQNVPHSFTVEYRSNVTFPMKIYDEFVYPAGEYEAILISIGEGKGSNWWCVLFPPLCFIDFSNGSTVAEDSENEQSEDEDNIAEEDIDGEEIDQEESIVRQEEEDKEEDQEEVEVKFFLFEWLGLS